MIKYNIMIVSLKDIDTSDLDYLIDTYDVRVINIESKNRYDYYNYIITENDIVNFLSELPFDYFVKHVFDDTIYQINISKQKKKADIYRNNRHDKLPNYKHLFSPTEDTIFSICKYIEKNSFI
jgi:hypothetical protein